MYIANPMNFRNMFKMLDEVYHLFYWNITNVLELVRKLICWKDVKLQIIIRQPIFLLKIMRISIPFPLNTWLVTQLGCGNMVREGIVIDWVSGIVNSGQKQLLKRKK